jgi:hypothetical protein
MVTHPQLLADALLSVLLETCYTTRARIKSPNTDSAWRHAACRPPALP